MQNTISISTTKTTQMPEPDEAFDDIDVVAVVTLDFVENANVNEGMCSCVCINDEKCCGCILQ